MQNHDICKTYSPFVSELNTAGFGIQEASTVNTPDVKYKTRLRVKKKEHIIKDDDPLWKRVYKAHPGPVLFTFLALKFGLGMSITHWLIPKFCPQKLEKLKNFSFKHFEKNMNQFKKFKSYSDNKKWEVFETTRKWLDRAFIASGVLGAAYMYTTEQYEFYFEKMMEGIDQEIKTVKTIAKKTIKPKPSKQPEDKTKEENQ